ncbi:cytochrome c oxidase subunit 2 [Jatrophihabitans sp. GAS493]|uniref:aa3-type cytochrome oxidase subunit II n=1 Tax=Jatrophihabitans sp. GAS493 TaxID=1907575 RepID=UPI000BC0DA45|nr:cytochrome c oxidase subunit II [Jatrophihabitans sp. GAS493]SOD74395.1 cytochrome c oxidase subunit 2 [Jatrophihabitans sp. GAS493]
MQRKRWMRPVRFMLLSAAAMVSLAGCSAHDIEAKLRFGWPTGVTDQATKMRVLWTWSSVAALTVGVCVWGLIFWACIRYRKKSDELPKQTRYNHVIEWAYTIAPFFVIAGLFFFTVKTENNVNRLSKNPDVLVQVDAFKWNWQFEYLQDHGTQLTYPGTSPAEAPSTVGSSEEIPILLIPRGETVQFVEHSSDVIHAFWVPEFLFKRDVIPYGTTSTARDNRFEITPTTDGSYVGRCAELCGTYHSQMNFEVRVVDPDVYRQYLDALTKIGPTDPARQSKALAEIGQAPYATTTHPFNTDRNVKSAS